MNIAILMGGLQFDSQQELLKSVWKCAKEDGSNLFVFLCSPSGKEQYNKGELKIFDLPDLKVFDGVIYLEDTLPVGPIRKHVSEMIRKEKIPCSCLNSENEDMATVSLDNIGAMEQLVTHLVEKHGVYAINYICGPQGNKDAMERLQAIRNITEKFGLPFTDDQIYFGDYLPESGIRAIRHFEHSMQARPDVYICANDAMALGAYTQLREYGIRVPQDVLLTGFDNTYSAKNHMPRITSVERGNLSIGRMLYENLVKEIRGVPFEKKVYARCAPVYAESCGCSLTRLENDQQIFNMYASERINQSLQLNMMRNSQTEFMEVASFGEFMDCVKKYVERIDPDGFFLCLNGTEEEFRNKINMSDDRNQMTVGEEYADELGITVVYTEHHFEKNWTVKKGAILPQEYLKGKQGSLFILQPIHYLEHNYGYCVICNSKAPMENAFYQFFVMNISDAMENIRKQELLVTMVDKLKKVWIYDTLTGIYNRAGFQEFANQVLQEAREKKENLFFLFLDLDCLKKINDEYGHDSGDQMIRAMAEILRETHRHGEVLMRYGGDEFVIFGAGYSEDAAREMIERIRKDIILYNENHPEKSYQLSASIGYHIEPYDTKATIEELISCADKKMYQEKKTKRRN